MQQLTAKQFISEFQIAPSWILARSLSTMQLQLTVLHSENEEPVMYLGPDPLEMKSTDYRIFLKEVEEVAAGHAEGAGKFRVEP